MQDVTVASAVLFILPDGMGTAPANRKMWSKDAFSYRNPQEIKEK
ncbi:hypothetical protein D805_1280 [Bifidobacterium thermophilum RBL67]|uniref:Uncharacterized protein n=1 Tax=Bifidobacterium thermophilum RBL67 TaxID=1254439 RepID=M4RST8_9BIFI|nr:hypothetical protein D805_1280 [Bifidobacterium thermophilum RBL67]